MRILTSTCYALSISAAIVVLVGCSSAGSQVAPSVPPPQTGVKLESRAPGATVLERAQNRPGYVLVDLGTFGGPSSLINANLAIYIGNCCNGAGLTPALTERGETTGGADTPVGNPASQQNPEACCDFYRSQTFEWRGNALRNLGTLPHGYNSFAYALNASGAAAGVSDFGVIDPFGGYPEQHPVLWKGGGIVDLGTFGGTEGVAFSINDDGEVVGFAQNTISDPYGAFGYAGQSRAFLYRARRLVDLGTLGSGNDAEAAFVNRRGEIAGASYTNAAPNSTTGVPTMDPFVWYRGKMRDLGTLGGTYGFTNGLSDRGEVVGQMNLSGDSAYHPFLWQNGKLNDLGTLGGSSGTAVALNEAGTVVGRADIPSSIKVHHAFRWQGGKMKDLGVPNGGGPCSTAYSINAHGQIVGDSGTCTAPGPSFLWENGTMYNLVSLVLPGSDLTLEGVRRINNRGEISCEGTAANGDVHACLLVPVDLARREGLVNVIQRSDPPKASQSTWYFRKPLGGPRYAAGPA